MINRTSKILSRALPKALKAIWWILKMMIPVSLAVTILQYFGILQYLSVYLNPAFKLIGLPGESALVFITGALLSIYACIAVIGTMMLNMREITILALMCLISHNLIVETAVQKRAGSSGIRIVSIRLLSSFIAAIFLNWALPQGLSDIPGISYGLSQAQSFHDLLINWGESSFLLTIKVILIITGLLFLHELFEEFGLLKYPLKFLSPYMYLMGLSQKTAFQWFVGYVVGLAYGAAIMFEEVDSGRLPKEDADVLNQHLAISHSQLEDTLLFVSIGVGALWITIPRIILAMAVVWLHRFALIINKRLMNKRILSN